MMDADAVECPDVEATGTTGLTLICRVNGHEVFVPTSQILHASTVHRPGDRGTLIIPAWLAHNLGISELCRKQAS